MRSRSAAFSGLFIMLALGVFVGIIVGWVWAFIALAGMWISGHFVAWFRRHPPPPEAFTGGKNGD